MGNWITGKLLVWLATHKFHLTTEEIDSGIMIISLKELEEQGIKFKELPNHE